MEITVLFGNGLNRVFPAAISWGALLDKIKGDQPFSSQKLPNTMVYERIYLGRKSTASSDYELSIKNSIAEALESLDGNIVYEQLISLKAKNYLTTNYDSAFEKSSTSKFQSLGTEEIYSLRRKKEFYVAENKLHLWNIHGEINHPKTIMLGLDHYCGSLSKLDSYIKGGYKYTKEGKEVTVQPMHTKILNGEFCNTSWVDLLFSSNVHILGLSLDFSELDLWWVLNKRARLPCNNKIYYYTNENDDEKNELLKSFGVKVVYENIVNNDFLTYYKSVLEKIKKSK